jgi:hypothetical protein
VLWIWRRITVLISIQPPVCPIASDAGSVAAKKLIM